MNQIRVLLSVIESRRIETLRGVWFEPYAIYLFYRTQKYAKMMPETVFDRHDPWYEYLKKTPMISATPSTSREIMTIPNNVDSNDEKRKNDREAIRRRLAMGEEDDYFTDHLAISRPMRKPNLQTRLQNGKNLQICFMNEAASDTESQSSDSETCPKLSKFNGNSHRTNKFFNRSGRSSLKISPSSSNSSASLAVQSDVRKERPKSLSLGPPINESSEVDFYTHQSRMQVEARMALAQAKDMAHMQMEIDRKNQRSSPITELVHKTLGKVGVRVPETKRRMCRQMLTGMNVAQLQIIVNDLHTFIETLNERLVHYLMDRDDLHMKQDSMLVDVEDITRYLAEKTEANGSSQTVKKLQHPKHINPKPAAVKRSTRVTLSSFSSSTSTSIAKHV